MADMKATREAFEEALIKIIENAPDKAQQELFVAFKAYKAARTHQFHKILAKGVFSCIEDGLSDLFMEEELAAQGEESGS